MNVPFLGELPIEQSIRESGDFGSPAALQDKTNVSSAFEIVTKRMLNELIKRNKNLPPTEVVRIRQSHTADSLVLIENTGAGVALDIQSGTTSDSVNVSAAYRKIKKFKVF